MNEHVLITGGAGFIGRHLALNLHRQGHPVTVLDRLDNPNARFSVGELTALGIEVVAGDVADLHLVRALIDGHRTVVHLAAPTVGVEQMLGAAQAHAGALTYAAQLAAMLSPEHTLLFSSTSDVYGLHSVHYGDKAMAEDDLTVYEAPTVSRWNYSKVKALAEEVFASCPARSVSVRIFNTYGPGFDYPQARRVIPQFAAAVSAGTALRVSGHGGQHRAFCYIGDTVDGIARALAFGRTLPEGGNAVFNIGNDDPDAYVSMLQLAETMADLAVALGFVTERPVVDKGGYHYSRAFDDTWNRRPDITRARALLGFAPRTTLADGLAEVLAFHARQAGRTQEHCASRQEA
ncbi:NAD-dependent epimerase/dehydratase family protein [Streptomyces rubellomurinus]|uniref:NAD-dependent epimerase/dehydratase domain-containing protein n=1 Tax=Streptomyces rubellomurinus (strain ATCC 31215) TaxID=359131 RepID=A0A0F2T476_STRR3|nr:NAD(P)-dependent oxidoreductase [Streptomyces rubellomurinus]KJS58019.1 hypothetical protein VM95_35985 [Streptomyces rubellomurinus]